MGSFTGLYMLFIPSSCQFIQANKWGGSHVSGFCPRFQQEPIWNVMRLMRLRCVPPHLSQFLWNRLRRSFWSSASGRVWVSSPCTAQVQALAVRTDSGLAQYNRYCLMGLMWWSKESSTSFWGTFFKPNAPKGEDSWNGLCQRVCHHFASSFLALTGSFLPDTVTCAMNHTHPPGDIVLRCSVFLLRNTCVVFVLLSDV